MNITRRSPLQPRPISCSGMYSRAPENICIELALRRTWGKPWGKEINIWCYGLHKTWIKVHKMFGVLKVINEPVGTSVFLWRNRSSLEKATLATWLQTNRCLNGYVAALFFVRNHLLGHFVLSQPGIHSDSLSGTRHNQKWHASPLLSWNT